MKKKRTLQIVLLLLVIELPSLLITTEPSRSAPARIYYAANLRYPLVIAHQGGDGLWPGNTMYAFQQAVDLGVDAIETDVRLSKDGVLALMHDGHVDHTTNGSGLIEDMTLSELESLDAAFKWSSDGGESFPFRGKGISVLTLEEAFQALPQTRFVLDVKRTETRIEQQLCDLIRQYEMTDQVVVASIYDDIISRFRKDCPEVASSAAFSEVTLFVFTEKSHLNGWVSPSYESLQGPYDPTGLFDNLILTTSYMRDAHALNVRVEPWTDDPSVMQYYIDIGVDGLITDYPDILLKLLDRD